MRAIILAGGSGKRLWPLSSEEVPKQFLSFDKKGSLLKQTVARFTNDHEVVVVGSEKYAPMIEKELVSCLQNSPSKLNHLLPPRALLKSPLASWAMWSIFREHWKPKSGRNFLKNSVDKTLGASLSILVEPAPRSTAPAILFALKYLIEKKGASKEEVCIVSPSDHYFEKEEDFLHLLPAAEKGARGGAIVTFGITPTYPETGYGYIKTEEGEVKEFVEKPDLERATHFLEEGNYYWNGGIFAFQIGTFLKECETYAPTLFEWFKLPYSEAMVLFHTLPQISIDHAIMEKTENILLIPYPSGWSDLGSWDRLEEALPKDEQGNFFSGDIEAIETEGSMIFGDEIVALGVKDLVIIKQDGKVVICPKKELHRLSETRSCLVKEK